MKYGRSTSMVNTMKNPANMPEAANKEYGLF